MDYEKALELATKYHKGQKRWNGEPYISHPIAVADKFIDEDHKIVAVLHDIVEDTLMTIFSLENIHYLKFEQIEAISILTREPNQTYLDYILRLKTNKLAKDVKIEDLKHNLSDIQPGNLKEKYLMALYILEEKE